jgi:hypothetical protein
LIGEKEAKKISARAGGESLLPRGACHRQGVSIYTLQKRQGEVLEKHLGSTRGSKELFVAWGSSRVFN